MRSPKTTDRQCQQDRSAKAAHETAFTQAAAPPILALRRAFEHEAQAEVCEKDAAEQTERNAADPQNRRKPPRLDAGQHANEHHAQAREEQPNGDARHRLLERTGHQPPHMRIDERGGLNPAVRVAAVQSKRGTLDVAHSMQGVKHLIIPMSIHGRLLTAAGNIP